MSIDNQSKTINKIVDIKDSLPKRQRQLCDYILKNYQSIGLITVKELADNAEVGISTVMRTINALGYENFNDLQKDIYDESIASDSGWTLKKYFTDIQKDEGRAATLVQVWNESVNLLNKTGKKYVCFVVYSKAHIFNELSVSLGLTICLVNTIYESN
ncbi:MurR/RpiR family transcriptional regulator [Niallia endozanthoxylica]|uniref:MurR/RpiR family transcriptional regulator n=2 Tax=Niallia endozanthoxylica TaxID=2036016 RepID=A0A5J5HQK1_9BACI|nr:MurR/RpiR family transcriptional regulator [Niallia endozanthoxylica]